MPTPFRARTAAIIAAGVVLASGIALTADSAHAKLGATRTMTCHEMLRGTPSADPTVYTLRGTTLYGPGGRILSTTKMRSLGSTLENGRRSQSWAKHVITRDGVLRSVYWEGRDGKPRFAFSDRYDFTRQRIVNTRDGTDSCHHSAGRR